MPGMQVNDGGPAFPCKVVGEYQGMSLRDYFAGQAIFGIIATTTTKDVEKKGWGVIDAAVHVAYKYADAMLEARKR